MTIPVFTGDITNAEDIARYITSPANKALATQDELIAGLLATMATKPDFYDLATEPESAKKGDRWTSSVTGQRRECVETYTTTEPNKASKWVLTAGEYANTQVQLQASEGQLNGAFVDQTFIDFGADSDISPEEKVILKTYYDEAVNEKPDIDNTVVFFQEVGNALYVDYVAKWNALVAYVDTTTALFADMNVSTAVTPAQWNPAWTEFRVARTGIRNLLLQRANTIIEDLSGDVDSVQNQIDTISNDSIISVQEKRSLYREWTDVIIVNKLKLDAVATTLGVTTSAEYVAYVAGYDALDLYLNTTITLFSPLTSDTDLVGEGSNATEFQAKWNDYYTLQSAVDKFLDERFESNIDTNRTEYLALISAISDDGVISGGTEKQQLLQTWKDIESEDANLVLLASQYTVTVPGSYSTAFSDLDTYLNITLGIFGDMTADTAINASVFYGHFDTYRTEADALGVLVVNAQKVAVETGNPDFGVVKQQVEAIADEGLISAGAEKIKAIGIWQDIQASHASFLDQANTVGVSIVDIQAKYDQLEAYLNALTPSGGGSPNFLVTGEDTSIGATAYLSNHQQYYVARDVLVQNVINALQSGLTSVSSSILDINNDGIVTVIEKNTLQQQMVEYTAEVASLNTQADTLSIVTAKNDMNTAWNTLNLFLDSLDGGNGIFDDMNSATQLSAGEQNQWDIDFANFFATKTALETEIITTLQANVVTLNTTTFLRDGSRTMTGNIDMETGGVKNYILNLKEFPVGATAHGATVNQVYTEQLARISAIAQEVIDRDSAIATAISTNVTSREGAIGGLATLEDVGGFPKVPVAQLPALSIVDVHEVADIAERDALTVQEADVAIVADAGGGVTKTYIYSGTAWIELNIDITGKADITGQIFSGDIQVNKATPIVSVRPITDGADAGLFEVKTANNATVIARLSASSDNRYWIVTTDDANIALDVANKLIVNIPDVPTNGTDAVNSNFVNSTIASALNATARSGAGGGLITGSGASQNVDVTMAGADYAETGAVWSFTCNIIVGGGTAGGAEYGIINIAGHYNNGTWFGDWNYVRTFSISEEAQNSDITTGGLVSFINQNLNQFDFQFSVPSANVVRCAITAPSNIQVRYQIVV